jgi:rhodanese-related sulfurtransferase
MAKAKKKMVSKKSKRGVPLWVWGVLLVAVVGIVALVWIAGNPPAATQAVADEVSVSQAADLREQGAFVLDVREQEEWDAGHIPGATLIPLGELQTRLSEVPQDQTVLVYCRSGNRSASGRDILKAAGYENVTSMAGGINAWIAAGNETVTGR